MGLYSVLFKDKNLNFGVFKLENSMVFRDIDIHVPHESMDRIVDQITGMCANNLFGQCYNNEWLVNSYLVDGGVVRTVGRYAVLINHVSKDKAILLSMRLGLPGSPRSFNEAEQKREVDYQVAMTKISPRFLIPIAA